MSPLSEDPGKRYRAYRLVILFGIVALLGDVVYEGGRSVAGPFLFTLGASAFAVAFIAGFGEFVGYGIRIATGVGWMCLVAAELFGVSNYGLGQKLWFYYNLHQMDAVVVYMIILGLIGLAFDMIFRYYVDRHFLKWRTGEVA